MWDASFSKSIQTVTNHGSANDRMTERGSRHEKLLCTTFICTNYLNVDSESASVACYGHKAGVQAESVSEFCKMSPRADSNEYMTCSHMS